VTAKEFRVWFGSQMRAARTARGLSMSALAHDWPVKIDPGQIGEWERGDVWPGPDKVAIYLEVLGLTPEEVFSGRCP